MPQVNLSQVLMHQYRDIADTNALVSEATYTGNNLPVPTNGAEAVLADGRVFKLLGTSLSGDDFTNMGQPAGWPTTVYIQPPTGAPSSEVMEFVWGLEDSPGVWYYSGPNGIGNLSPSEDGVWYMNANYSAFYYSFQLAANPIYLVTPPSNISSDYGVNDIAIVAGPTVDHIAEVKSNWRTVVIANENDEIEGPIIVDEGTDSETLESGTLKVVGGSLVVHDGATAGGRPAAGMTPWEAASSTLSVEDNKQYVINLTSGDIDISTANMSYGGTCNLIIYAAAEFTLTCEGSGTQCFLYDGRAWMGISYYFDSLASRGHWFVRVDKLSIAGFEHRYFMVQGGRESL